MAANRKHFKDAGAHHDISALCEDFRYKSERGYGNTQKKVCGRLTVIVPIKERDSLIKANHNIQAGIIEGYSC